jgi:hypothetical protein
MRVGSCASLVVAATLVGCGPAAGPLGTPSPTAEPPTASPPRTPVPSPTLRPGVARAIPFGEAIWGVAAAGDAVWIEGNNRLYQVDGRTGEIRQELEGWWPTVRGDSLWYMRDDHIVEADAITGAELNTHATPVPGTTVHDGVQWADDERAGALLAIDLATGQTLHQIDLPEGEAKWVEHWQGAIWVLIDGSDVVVRVDPHTGKIIDDHPAGSRPHSVVTAFGSLWVTDHGTAAVQRFAPDGTLEATILGPGLNVAITATDTSVWSASPTGVMEIEPSTNEVGRRVELGSGDWYGMAWSAGSLLLTSADGGTLYQIPVE